MLMTCKRHRYDIKSVDTGGHTFGDALSKAFSLMVVSEFSRELKNALGHRRKRP